MSTASGPIEPVGEPLVGSRQPQKVARFRSTFVGRYDEGSWREEAACKDVSSAIFFPAGPAAGTPAATALARAICASCPVIDECLDFAVATNQQYGVWGGCDEEERRDLRRQWRAARRAIPAPQRLLAHPEAS